MKPVCVVLFVSLLATAVFAGSPPIMTPAQQYQTLIYRDAQFAARYGFFLTSLNKCGGTEEETPQWAAADATFNSYVIGICYPGAPKGTQVESVYDIPSNQCLPSTGITMTQDQQYQTLQYRIAQWTARYAALDPQAQAACTTPPNTGLPPISADWVTSDTNMNNWLTATCGSPAHYSTSSNNCK